MVGKKSPKVVSIDGGKAKIEEAKKILAEANQARIRRCQEKFAQFTKEILEEENCILDVIVQIQAAGQGMFMAVPNIIFRTKD